MFSTSDNWLGIGIAMMIGLVIVVLATCLGKSIIWLFGTEQRTMRAADGGKTIKSEFHEAT